MSDDWRVLIVEDDPDVANVHRLLIARSPHLVAVGIAPTARAAAEAVATQRPHLVLLDLGLPDRSGLSLLRDLRGATVPVEVIAITASAKSSVIRTAIHLGVLEYLVKPFAPERLQLALSRFHARMRTLAAATLDQRAVDAVRGEGAPERRLVPKGLSVATLEQIRTVLAAAAEPQTAELIADATGVSRVTARRYLEYLVTLREIDTGLAPPSGGRPQKLYARTELL